MENTKQTHYRKVFKSDHLGIADLEDFQEQGKRLIFNIREVKQEYGVKVAGRNGDFNIAYFVEDIKPLVLNATNSKTLRTFNKNSPFVEDWSNTIVELYIDQNVKLKGEIVGGVRISPKQPSTKRPDLNPNMPAWTNAIAAVKSKKFTLSQVLGKYSLTSANEKLFKDAI